MKIPKSFQNRPPNETSEHLRHFTYYSDQQEHLRNTTYFALYSEKIHSFVDLLQIGKDPYVKLFAFIEKPVPVRQVTERVLAKMETNRSEEFCVTSFITTWSFDYHTNTVWCLSQANHWYQLNSAPFDECREVWEPFGEMARIWFELYRIIETLASDAFGSIESSILKNKDKPKKVEKYLNKVGKAITWEKAMAKLENPDDEEIIRENSNTFSQWMREQSIVIVAEDDDETEFQFQFDNCLFYKRLSKSGSKKVALKVRRASPPPSPETPAPPRSTKVKKRKKLPIFQEESPLKKRKHSTNEKSTTIKKRKEAPKNDHTTRKKRKVHDDLSQSLDTQDEYSDFVVPFAEPDLEDQECVSEKDDGPGLSNLLSKTIPKKSAKHQKSRTTLLEELSHLNICSKCGDFSLEFVSCNGYGTKSGGGGICHNQTCVSCCGQGFTHFTQKGYWCDQCAPSKARGRK